MLKIDADVAAVKAVGRAAAKRRRAAAHAASPDAGARIAANLLRAVSLPEGAIVSGYCAMGDEADPLPSLLALAAGGHDLCLPVTPKRGLPLSFRLWRPGDALERGVWDIPVPPATARDVEPSVLLVPLLAFDRAGYRLGYGGGYFDRTLAALRPRPLTIGIGTEAARLATIHPQPHDIGLDMIVTEAGIRHTRT